MDDLEEMDRFLEKLKHPRLNQEETEIMNKLITSIEIETVIKTLPKNKNNNKKKNFKFSRRELIIKIRAEKKMKEK